MSDQKLSEREIWEMWKGPDGKLPHDFHPCENCGNPMHLIRLGGYRCSNPACTLKGKKPKRK